MYLVQSNAIGDMVSRDGHWTVAEYAGPHLRWQINLDKCRHWLGFPASHKNGLGRTVKRPKGTIVFNSKHCCFFLHGFPELIHCTSPNHCHKAWLILDAFQGRELLPTSSQSEQHGLDIQASMFPDMYSIYFQVACVSDIYCTILVSIDHSCFKNVNGGGSFSYAAIHHYWINLVPDWKLTLLIIDHILEFNGARLTWTQLTKPHV